MIKAVLVDDETNALEMLEWQIHHYCPKVQVVNLCKGADEGIAAIRAHKPDLLFLDIEMPRKNGFDVVQAFPEPCFDVIFTTAYSQFAIKAFKFAALDYLLKPIDAEELVAAVERFEKKQHQLGIKDQFEMLMHQYRKQHSFGKIAFATHEGVMFVSPDNIVHCTSSSNYTTLYFADKSKLVVSKTLKEVEDLLQPYSFFRVHHSHLINLRQVVRYLKADGGLIEMCTGAQLPVSRQRKDLVLNALINKP